MGGRHTHRSHTEKAGLAPGHPVAWPRSPADSCRPRSRSQSQGPGAARATGPVRWQLSGPMMWVVAGAVSRERTHRGAGNCNELFNSVDKNKRTLSGVSFSHWMVREVLVSSTLLCITDLLHTSRFACFQRKRTEGFGRLEGPTAAILSGTASWVPRQHLPPPHFWPPGLPTLGTIPHRDHPTWDPSNSNRQRQPAGRHLPGMWKTNPCLGESHCPH